MSDYVKEQVGKHMEELQMNSASTKRQFQNTLSEGNIIGISKLHPKLSSSLSIP